MTLKYQELISNRGMIHDIWREKKQDTYLWIPVDVDSDGLRRFTFLHGCFYVIIFDNQSWIYFKIYVCETHKQN